MPISFFSKTHIPGDADALAIEVSFINILISGKPRVGKTTLIKKVVFHFHRNVVGGFYTQEILQHGQRIGFAISTFDGKVGILAHRDYVSPFKVGKYKVNMVDLEGVAVRAIEDAIDEGKDLIVIDEIGKMELFSENFKQSVLHALEDEVPVVGTIMAQNHPFTDKIKRRKDVKVLTATLKNRGVLSKKILERLGIGFRYMYDK